MKNTELKHACGNVMFNNYRVLPMPGCFETTIKNFAAFNDLDYPIAQGIIKFLVTKGYASEVGHVKTSLSGKGKPSTVYELPNTVNLKLAS